MKNKKLILNQPDISQKIKRMSYEILENNYDEKELVFIGITNNGLLLAKRITSYLKTISSIAITLSSVKIDKEKPVAGEIEIDIEGNKLNNKVVILVDDVANSGRTLSYSMRPLLQFSPKKIQVAVLVDRRHKLFPVSPDYVGLSLSTTMREHVAVEMKAGDEAVFLS
jgi:pyrimidine operon attenuation protein / uracil phosphoribosyltransferase